MYLNDCNADSWSKEDCHPEIDSVTVTNKNEANRQACQPKRKNFKIKDMMRWQNKLFELKVSIKISKINILKIKIVESKNINNQ